MAQLVVSWTPVRIPKAVNVFFFNKFCFLPRSRSSHYRSNDVSFWVSFSFQSQHRIDRIGAPLHQQQRVTTWLADWSQKVKFHNFLHKCQFVDDKFNKFNRVARLTAKSQIQEFFSGLADWSQYVKFHNFWTVVSLGAWTTNSINSTGLPDSQEKVKFRIFSGFPDWPQNVKFQNMHRVVILAKLLVARSLIIINQIKCLFDLSIVSAFLEPSNVLVIHQNGFLVTKFSVAPYVGFWPTSTHSVCVQICVFSTCHETHRWYGESG